MDDLRKAAEMALKALENPWSAKPEGVADAIEALRQALAQPEQEPVAWMLGDNFYTVKQCNLFGQDSGKEKPNQIPLYTAPPKREWVGLDKHEIVGLTCDCIDQGEFTMECAFVYARAIEENLKEKNFG